MAGAAPKPAYLVEDRFGFQGRHLDDAVALYGVRPQVGPFKGDVPPQGLEVLVQGDEVVPMRLEVRVLKGCAHRNLSSV